MDWNRMSSRGEEEEEKPGTKLTRRYWPSDRIDRVQQLRPEEQQQGDDLVELWPEQRT